MGRGEVKEQGGGEPQNGGVRVTLFTQGGFGIDRRILPFTAWIPIQISPAHSWPFLCLWGGLCSVFLAMGREAVSGE